MAPAAVAKAAVGAQAAVASRDPAFWQALLALEWPPAKSRTLIEEFGSSSANVRDFFANHRLLQPADRRRVELSQNQSISSALEAGIRVIERDAYGSTLSEARYLPPALFSWGAWEATKAPTVGIVGTRGASTYGKAAAIKFSEALANAGVTIVSGGALGIDAAAHRGAVSVGGRTVAVFGGGVDRVYPAVNRALFDQIRANGGCLVSQFSVGSSPNAYRFLVRNHLIAALSQVVVAIEVPERSGALSTVHHANELGRQVFVVPANIGHASFRGSHDLIRDGATLVDHPDQILEAIGLERQVEPERAPPGSSVAAKILALLGSEPLPSDKIVQLSGLDPSEVMSELTMMEMSGHVSRDGAGYTVRL